MMYVNPTFNVSWLKASGEIVVLNVLHKTRLVYSPKLSILFFHYIKQPFSCKIKFTLEARLTPKLELIGDPGNLSRSGFGLRDPNAGCLT